MHASRDVTEWFSIQQERVTVVVYCEWSRIDFIVVSWNEFIAMYLLKREIYLLL